MNKSEVIGKLEALLGRVRARAVRGAKPLEAASLEPATEPPPPLRIAENLRAVEPPVPEPVKAAEPSHEEPVVAHRAASSPGSCASRRRRRSTLRGHGLRRSGGRRGRRRLG